MATELVALLPPLAAWFASVNKAVQEPYLDEFFHVRQAQHYCQGRFEIWDPKITTPPGLYFLSYLLSPGLGCSIASLRLINVICLVALFLVLRAADVVRRRTFGQDSRSGLTMASHSSLNLVLFPPLFFFSALYYTDVASTLSVAVFYWYFLHVLDSRRRTLVQSVVQVMLGAATLMFRQTNIFWVAVAPAAVILVSELDQGHHVVKESMYERAQGFGDTTYSIVKTSWKMNVIYDPPVRDAFLEDYFCTILSLAVCAVKALTQLQQVLSLVKALFPYLTLIAMFAAFIIWNGSVVLGDKSNHIATINLPQMLYIWPFMVFFSYPLVMQQLILVPMAVLSQVATLAGFKPLVSPRQQRSLPRIWVLCVFTLLAGVIIRFNTVVHPFTLADNRHYVFYVFKRLLRPWWVRYFAAPVYVLIGWACIAAHGDHFDADSKSSQTSSTTTTAATHKSASTDKDPQKQTTAPPSNHQPPLPTSTTHVLIFCTTTALALCSAPLVEPRYCIIPWILWRIHMPLEPSTQQSERDQGPVTKLREGYLSRLVLETLWLLAVNAATLYIFLSWTFEWPQEPGQAQRFMW